MRLVHCDHRHSDPSQHANGGPCSEAFGRDVEKLHPPGIKRLPDLCCLFFCIARCERARLDTHRLQRAHLVAHERDQRGDYNGHAVAHQGWQLKAERFASACRHDGQSRRSRGHGMNDLFLS